jgi:hypothetical protein
MFVHARLQDRFACIEIGACQVKVGELESCPMTALFQRTKIPTFRFNSVLLDTDSMTV